MADTPVPTIPSFTPFVAPPFPDPPEFLPPPLTEWIRTYERQHQRLERVDDARRFTELAIRTTQVELAEEAMLLAARRRGFRDPRIHNPWYFVTYTLDTDHHYLTYEECLRKLLSIAHSKSVKVKAYYGCKEYTKAGIMHFHVIYYVENPGKRGFGQSHLINFWKNGHMDIKRLQKPYIVNLQNCIRYIEKPDLNGKKKKYFGSKENILACPIGDVVDLQRNGNPATVVSPGATCAAAVPIEIENQP